MSRAVAESLAMGAMCGVCGQEVAFWRIASVFAPLPFLIGLQCSLVQAEPYYLAVAGAAIAGGMEMVKDRVILEASLRVAQKSLLQFQLDVVRAMRRLEVLS